MARTLPLQGPGVSPLARDVDRFQSELMREAYLSLSGQKARSQEARVYTRHKGLFQRAALKRLPPGPPEEALRLRRFVTQGIIDRRLAPLKDRRETMVMESRVEFRGERLPYHSASQRIAQLGDRAARRELYTGLATTWRRVEPASRAYWRAFQTAVRNLGYRDGRAAAEALMGYDVEAILRETRDFARRTAGLYRGLLRESAEKADLPFGSLRIYDRAWLLRGHPSAQTFPRAGLRPFLLRALKDLGLPAGVFIMDLEDRPRKHARAFCAPVRTPGEVYLVLKPQGGFEDYHTGLHEMGHALHFGLTDPSLSPTFRGLGDGSLTEGYAFILDLLFLNPTFLSTLTRDPAFPRAYALSELNLLRRYTGKVEYESRFFRDPLASDLPDRYIRAVEASTGYRADENRDLGWLCRQDVDPWMYSFTYVRAWMFAGQMTELLEERWGDRWWRRPEAGAFLKGLFAWGTRPTVTDLLEEFGRGELTLRPLEALLRRTAG